MTRQLTEDKARECLEALKKQFQAHVDSGATMTLHEPGFHADAWTISCEEIDDWPFRAFTGGFDEEVFHLARAEAGDDRARELAKDKGVALPAGVFAEAVNHWCLALYPDDTVTPASGPSSAGDPDPVPPTMTFAQFAAEHPAMGDEIGDGESDRARRFVRALTRAPLSSMGQVYAVAHALLISGEPMQLARGSLTPMQAVTLTAELAGRGLFAPDTPADVAATIVCGALLGRFDTEPEAALYGLATVGSRKVIGVPSWMPAALADHDEYSVCEHLLSRVRLALENTAPGIRWVHVPGLDFVLYKTTGNEPPNGK